MTILEATVEIVKATLSTTGDNSAVLTNDNYRKDFLVGIETLYKKLEKLDENNLKH